jgi:MFS family permease
MTELAAPRRNRFLLAQWAELMDDDSFRRFWLMRLGSHGAINALAYSLLVFVVLHSTSAIATGILLLTLIVPSAFLGAIAGVAVDRLPRGLILCVANLLRVVLVFALIGAKDSLPSLYAVSLGLGIVTQFAAPAEAAVVPHIVRQHRLVAANSFINLGTLASQVLGMLVLAPVFLKTTNGDPLLFILMALFAVSAVLITVIPQFHFVTTEKRGEVSLRAVRRDFAEAWLRLSRDSTAFLGLVLLVATSTSTLVIATLLPKFATQVLRIQPENIVFVLAPSAIGVFVGLRSVEFISDRLNKLVTISAAYVLMAGSLIALGLVPASGDFIRSLDPAGIFRDSLLGERGARILATVIYANVFCFALTAVMTMGRVLINERIPIQMQGRVFAAQAVLANLTAILPVLLAGLLADALGVTSVLISAGVVALAAAVWSHARSSRVVAPAEPGRRPEPEAPASG